MSLTLDNVKDTKLIANVLKNSKPIRQIRYIDDDDVEGPALTRIRLNEKDEAFFPAITRFELTDQVDRCYITGETGCGKSTWIRAYVQQFLKIYPKSKVLLFSSKKEDKQLDDLKIERLDIDDDIYNNPYTLAELSAKSKPLLTIFDDIQDFPNKKINNEVARLRDEIMRNGRSYGIYSLFVYHDPCDYKATKNQLFECNKVVIFPKRCGKGAYNYLMDKKLHLSKKNIDAINSLKSNYVCINKGVPKYIISDKYIFLDK